MKLEIMRLLKGLGWIMPLPSMRWNGRGAREAKTKAMFPLCSMRWNAKSAWEAKTKAMSSNILMSRKSLQKRISITGTNTSKM